MNDALVTTGGQAGEVQLTATEPDEIAAAQVSLVDWCQERIARLRAEHGELEAAVAEAVKNKWKSEVLEKHARQAGRRVEFYSKMLTALEHGYVIIPNFPVRVFAVRTDRARPLRLFSTSQFASHEQPTQGLPAGEGEYKNPFPEVWQQTIDTSSAPGGAKVTKYFSEAWREFEFPLTMAKPQIMEATSKAMALRVFDDLGIFPDGRTRQQRAADEDPIIVARLRDPRSSKYKVRMVTFMVAWHLDTRVL